VLYFRFSFFNIKCDKIYLIEFKSIYENIKSYFFVSRCISEDLISSSSGRLKVVLVVFGSFVVDFSYISNSLTFLKNCF
jgi:hypothetical protein